jgi:predicted  nucleic acid-binding Zn-ribbon protein
MSAPERLELGEPDDLSGTFVDQIAKLKAKVAALEQERDAQSRLIRALEKDTLQMEREHRTELARLREAIGEIVDEIEEGAGMVHALKRLRTLTEGENDAPPV